VGFTDQATDKRYQFLTNRVGLSAFTMAAVYKGPLASEDVL
jgi:hypothetical protein